VEWPEYGKKVVGDGKRGGILLWMDSQSLGEQSEHETRAWGKRYEVCRMASKEIGECIFCLGRMSSDVKKLEEE